MNPRIGTDTCGNHSRKRSVNATTHPPVNKILIRILCLGLISREGRNANETCASPESEVVGADRPVNRGSLLVGYRQIVF